MIAMYNSICKSAEVSKTIFQKNWPINKQTSVSKDYNTVSKDYNYPFYVNISCLLWVAKTYWLFVPTIIIYRLSCNTQISNFILVQKTLHIYQFIWYSYQNTNYPNLSVFILASFILILIFATCYIIIIFALFR